MSTLSLQKVSMRFAATDGEVIALDRIDLAVESQEVVSVVGPSGCGKTTVLNLVAGFLTPTEGTVLINGRVAGPPSAERTVVFQADAVFPWLTVRENLEYGPSVRGQDRETYTDRVDRFLQLVGLSDFASAYPKTLSGGMRKRVDLARAYVSNPNVLLMDEPFGALDIFTKEAMWEVLHTVLEQERKTVVFVTHDIEEAIFVADRVIVMSPRPARIEADLPVPFGFPRDLSLRTTTEFQEMRQQIAHLLTEQVG